MNKLLQKVYSHGVKKPEKMNIDVQMFEQFVLTEKRMMASLQPIMRSNKKEEKSFGLEQKQKQTQKQTEYIPCTDPDSKNMIVPEYFFPKVKDDLFWCFFIMKYGKESYDDLGKINIVVERKWKIDYIELLRKNKQLLKNNKMAPLPYIENFLLNETKIDIKTFLALCLVENLHVMYIHKQIFYEIGEEEEEQPPTVELNINSFVLKRTDNPLKYGYKAASELDVSHIIKTFYKIDNLLKPLKATTYYKLEDLINFCKKLQIDVTMPKLDKKTKMEIQKSKRKKDLYEDLVKYFS